jgi:hypothetical protein
MFRLLKIGFALRPDVNLQQQRRRRCTRESDFKTGPDQQGVLSAQKRHPSRRKPNVATVAVPPLPSAKLLIEF